MMTQSTGFEMEKCQNSVFFYLCYVFMREIVRGSVFW